MDKKIERKHWAKFKYAKWGLLLVLAALLAAFLVFRDGSGILRIDKTSVSIEPVTRGMFQDYIQVVGVVEPKVYLFLDAIESGIVKEVLIEEGSMVRQGDVILRMTNINLNLSILESEAQVAEKSNFLRETRINMEQQKINLQKELLNLNVELMQKDRKLNQNKSLFSDELISKEEYLKSKEDYELTQRVQKLMLQRYKQDSVFRNSQIQKISQNLENMQRNLELVYQRQDNLSVKAPMGGQLGLLDAKPGQSVSTGQRLGQINVLTSFKIKANIDEHYINRIQNGLVAHLKYDTRTIPLKVVKVYPEVREGRFAVDLAFSGEMPANVRAGQSYNLSLQLGETKIAVLVPRGGFYQSTGGQWLYVLDPQGKTAEKRAILIGRQNPSYFEVLDGLQPGEQVITSGYELLGKSDRLIFQ